ncbi:hypothetical protein ONZ45_g6112 [Pleurotus djamor]|nr:hypothetical protein ONZ45_g14858 [Pleurotus djamor]KAJ8516580.1 hypothetical protein ONZ45_g6112 [Pleurotus djamor]
MRCFGPATPGFLVTLVATVLLGLVSFNVPYFRSLYFLKASISVNNVNGTITFGTLGYCLDLPNNSTCSKPAVGYQLDVNDLVDNNLPVEIPDILVKWITYVLFLHIVAFVLAGVSAVFGLLAHLEMITMSCCSSLVSGLASTVAMFAFIFDVALFFITKKRINSIPGGSAQTGVAIWLTLAAALALIFTGCFYAFGRCCVPSGHSRGRSISRDVEKGHYAKIQHS